MTDKEKQLYKSNLFQNEQEWKKITKKEEGFYNNSIGNGFNRQLLIPFKYGNFAYYAIKQYLKPIIQ